MKGKKLLTALLALAVAGTATSAIALAACQTGGGGEGKKRAGKTYYISLDGKSADEAKGTKDDPWEPWSGLQNNSLDAGDTVRIMPGKYEITERITIMKSGEYNNYINIVADDPTQETVLTFYQMTFDSTHRGVQIYGNYVHWDGVDIAGAGDNGMYVGGSYNIIENSRFYDNRDTGLQLGRNYSPDYGAGINLEYDDINYWPSYNLIKNCTSFNNYDNETYGENADGFAAKLTVGYGNVFDGCIAYRNSDDGWDLFAKTDSGNIGEVIIYNCVSFENGFILDTQEEFNKKFPTFRTQYKEDNTNKKTTRDGDGNGFKLGGSVMEGEVLLHNVLAFNNRMHGITDNSNPGVIIVDGATCYNNGAGVDSTGVIAYNGNGVDEGSANVDLARHYYSYNHIANVLSVNNGNDKISNDAYRGTVENSTFIAQNDKTKLFEAFLVEGQAEYYSKKGDRGIKTDVIPADQRFYVMPELSMGVKRNADNSWYDWHTALRNEDGSINMGQLLALKDADATQGSKLNLTKWEDYVHYGMHDLTKCASKDDAIAQAIIDMAYVPIRPEALYQDFDVVTKINNVKISWKSDNTSLIKVTDKAGTSNSKHEDVKVEVTRPDLADTEVTMTASVTVGKVTKTRDFKINVKRNTYRVYESGILINDLVGDNIIRDKGDSKFAFRIEAPVVLNDTSDSGAVIDPKNYEVTTFTSFATYQDPNTWVDNKAWDATEAGIWRVRVRITLSDDLLLAKKGDGSYNDDGTEVIADKVIEKTYFIYVADKGAENQFVVNSDSLSVNRHGFVLSGDFVSPTGNLYAVTLPTSAAAPTADEIKANENVQVHNFRTTGGSFQFEQANSEAYKVYYFIESIDGTQKSQVYSKTVNVQNIATKADFEKMLSSNDNATLYLQTADIDFKNEPISLAPLTTAFVGVFNGNGYKLSNINIKQTASGKEAFGLFTRVKGGTIMNANFESVVINDNGANEKTGLIGEMEGGYIYNVSIHNIDVNTGFENGKRVSIRVGGLIGQVFSTGGKGATTYIQKVSLVNDAVRTGNFGAVDHYEHIIRGDQRVGGIVGFIQSGSGTGWNEVYIDSCYVDAQIESNTYGGGIVGRSDDRNITGVDHLEITRCYFAGFNYTQKYCGGMLGGYTGSGRTIIVSCVSTGKLFYTDTPYEVMAAEKNCSHMVGYYATNGDATVMNCYANFADHNASFVVTGFGSFNENTETYFTTANYEDFWTEYLTDFDAGITYFETSWDLEHDWKFADKVGAYLKAPYVTLVMSGTATAE